MRTFAYTALDASGRRKTGFVDAETKEVAISKISADGKFVVEIKESEQKPVQAANVIRGRVTRSDLSLFTRRMADLSAAGLPLDRVLQVISEQSESPVLADVAQQVLESVRGGMPVSEALAQHPKYFSEVYTQTLRAGEASGQFPEVAGKLAEFQEMEVTRRSQIVSAMTYPTVLTLTAVAVVVFLLTFVVPRMSGVFADLGGDLPASTRLLLATTDFITTNGLLILGAIVGAVVLYRGWIATPAGRLSRDTALLKAPLIGPIVQKAVVSRYARVLGMLVYGGVPILESLHLAGLASGNQLFAKRSEAVREDVRDGRAIADAMRDAGAFPPVLTHMVAIGEETGDLPKMLSRVSDSLDFEVDNGMRRLTSLVEPTVVLAMGTIVGFVVLSVLLPIYQAQSLVK
ncbi:MAG: type II secretion system F family protein [Fimbriimonadales bacterium]|nr:type II secretion system F family protein [Fimbriimonadales bacterium]